MASNLRDAGFRFTFKKGGGWNWRYEVEEGDIDATDMDDSEFEAAVRSVQDDA